ncbi:extracellular solute-binding protein [Vallitalea okinawensis]|uniref:extracellular solute-binding protein n=1 Tax=Vallitalea okinawensis TaxID=2078660 RepID=UPI000CFB3225|nr:extracellular solute-binding protein [Vallitalea okinawensis]
MNKGLKPICLLIFLMPFLWGCTSSDSNLSHSKENREITKTLRIMIRDWDEEFPTGQTLTDNWTTRYSQKNFGDPNNIILEYVPIEQSNYYDELNIVMASGNPPDIIFANRRAFAINYAVQGMLHDLTEYYNATGENLKTALGDSHIRKFGMVHDELNFIPAVGGTTPIANNWIRKDWLDHLGLPVPTTVEQWYQTLKTFKEKDPGGIGTENVIPWAMYDLTHPTQYETFMAAFIEDMSEEDYYAYSYMNDFLKPGFEEGLYFLNKMYNEGLISPEFALDQDEKQFEKDIISGNAGFFVTNALDPLSTDSDSIYNVLKDNNQDAEIIPINPFQNSKGQYPTPQYQPKGTHIMVPKVSDVPDLAMMYLNWMAEPETSKKLYWGIEGLTYEAIDDFPVKLLTNKENEHIVLRELILYDGPPVQDKKQLWNVVSMGKVDYDLSIKALEIASTNPFYREPFFPEPLVKEAKYNTLMRDAITKLVTNAITCCPSDFQQVFESGVADIMKNGGSQIIDEKREVYRESIMK